MFTPRASRQGLIALVEIETITTICVPKSNKLLRLARFDAPRVDHDLFAYLGCPLGGLMGEPRRVVVRSVVVRTVLVVDDDDRILAACRRSLRLQGKTVFFARDAVTARHIARKERPDLAIVDLRLGNKQSGLDLLRVLKHDRAALKVVLVSGWMSLAVALAAVRAGADSFFAKPFSPREVLRHVENGTAPDLDLETTPSLERVEFEHIERVLADTNGNVAEAARRLGMYRQSLERKRRKRVPRT